MNKQMLTYFEEACIALEITSELPKVDMLPERNQKAIIAFYMLSVIIQWVNKGWIPDWYDPNQDKYYPWFSNGSAAGLACAGSRYAPSLPFASIGSRLCFKSHKLAIEWAEKLIPLYEDYLLIK